MANQTKNETQYIGDELSAEMEIDMDSAGQLDTRVIIDGEFWIDGNKRNEFVEKLGKLIDEYRI
ncbi:MAG: hypothetical protein QM500_19495 [Methylococcales bacterium]